jgi:hypothetical protein
MPVRRATKLRALFAAIAIFATVAVNEHRTSAVAAENPVTLPNGSTVGPRDPGYVPGLMPSEADGDTECGAAPFGGWEPVDRSQADGKHPRRVEGEVVIGHAPYGDFFVNHNTEDFNVHIVPTDHDPLSSDPDANYRYILAQPNFATGPQKLHGRVEVEWEYGAHTWNDAADSGYHGYPSWAWGATGDRVTMDGYWAFDCGHNEDEHEDNTTGYRTEIHPPWFTATIRNMAQSPMARGGPRNGSATSFTADRLDFRKATQADVFVSSFGGEAVDNQFDDCCEFDNDDFGTEEWWQPVNSRDYDFVIPLPHPRPAGAQPLVRIEDPPSGPWVRPGGAVSPAFDQSNISAPFQRGDRWFVNVHIPMSTVPDADYMLFAKRIWVGWDEPTYEVKRFRVTIDKWHVIDDLEDEISLGSDPEYSAWMNVGGEHVFVPVAEGDSGFDCDSDANYMPQCVVEQDEVSDAIGQIETVVVGNDPLLVQFRAKEGDVESPFGNQEGGFAMQSFTKDEDYGVGAHIVAQSDNTFFGHYPSHTECDDPDFNDECYRVHYTIERLLEPTAISIAQTTNQYAQDPNRFTAKVVTTVDNIGRENLPVKFTFTNGTSTQVINGTTGPDGVARPKDLITLPAGTYTLRVEFAGNDLLEASSTEQQVTILKDITATKHTVASKLRWGHRDPIKVTLTEPNVAQGELPLGIQGKNLTFTLTSVAPGLGTQSFPLGPTAADGTATITPLMTLPPGNYKAKACFAEDAWFLGSCSTETTIKVTVGFAGFATGGPITFGGESAIVTGDIHSEGAFSITGNRHTISAAPAERLEHVTTFSNTGTSNRFNRFQVPKMNISPRYLRSTYCGGPTTFMGVPVTYTTGNRTFNAGTVSGIHCVTGDITITRAVTGKAVFLATGRIITTGDRQSLTTADPSGADLLFLAGSTSPQAISLGETSGSYTGAMVATGGAQIASIGSVVNGGVIGSQIAVTGPNTALRSP